MQYVACQTTVDTQSAWAKNRTQHQPTSMKCSRKIDLDNNRFLSDGYKSLKSNNGYVHDMTKLLHHRGIACPVNTLKPRQNGRHFPDDIFKWIFLNENISISIKIYLKSVPEGPVNHISALVQVTICGRPGDKPISQPMMVSLLMHICVTRPQWVSCI